MSGGSLPRRRDPSMPITVTCPSCNTTCSVADQYAGAMVQCPNCKNIIVATRPGDAPPAPAAAAPVPPPIAGTPPPPPPPPGSPPTPPGPPALGLMESVDKAAQE